jgi:hypothetical protein
MSNKFDLCLNAQKTNLLKDAIKHSYNEFKEIHSKTRITNSVKLNNGIITDEDKLRLKFDKSRVMVFAGLYNKNVEMYNQGVSDFKKYSLETLELMGNKEDYEINIGRLPNNGEKRNTDCEKFINNEAYRQYADFIKENNEAHEKLKIYFFL